MAKEEILIDLKIDAEESNESINSLRASVREMTKARNDANLSTAEGRAQVENLNKSINAHNAKIKENVDALTKQKINVGNYKNEIVDASKELNLFGVNVGSASSKLTSFANPATLAVGVLGALSAAYARSTTGAKDLEFASNQLGTATGILSEKFAQLFSSAEDGEGFFSTVLNGLLFKISPELAIQSRLVALAQEKIQDLNREEIAQRTVINERLEENQEKLTRIQSEQSSIAEKAKLTKDIQDNLRLNADEQLAIKNKELQQLNIILALDKENESKQEAVLQKKREISDIERNTTKAIERIQKLQDNIVEGQVKRIEQEDAVKQKLQDQSDILAAQNEIKRVQAEEELLRAAGNSDALIAVNQYLNDERAASDAAYEELKAQEIERAKNSEIKAAEDVANRLKMLYQARFQIVSGLFGSISALIGKNTAEGKAAAIAEIGVNTAKGISRATAAGAKVPYPGNILAIISGIAAVLGGIAQAKSVLGFERGGVLKLNNGGLLNGPSHANGGIPFSVGGRLGFEAEGGETLINKRSSAMFRPILSAINRAGGGVAFEDGGVLGFPSSTISGSTNSFFDLSRLEQTISNLKVQVAVTDINDGQKNYAEIVDRAQF